MNTDEANEPRSSEPTGSPHRPPEPDSLPPYILPPVERLRRVHGLLDAVSDALQSDGREHSPHLEGRAMAVEIANDEIASIAAQIDAGVYDT